MSKALEIQLADEIVAVLNAATFPQSFTAERKYVVSLEPKELKDLEVSVVPAAVTEDMATRGADQVEVEIHIGIQKHTKNKAESDSLMLLKEEIRRHEGLRQLSIAALQSRASTLWLPEHMQKNDFTSVITLKYIVYLEI